VTGLIGCLLLALTPNVSGDSERFSLSLSLSRLFLFLTSIDTSALIAGIVLIVIACIALAGGITFCVCKGGDICDCCGN